MLRLVFALALTFTVLPVPTPAYATPVTVEGGFNSFSGVVGFGSVPGVGDAQTIVNGQLVMPFDPLRPDAAPYNDQNYPAVGYGKTQFPVTHTVEFYVLPEDLRNRISFTPAPPQEVAGINQRFLLGTVGFTNGSFWASAIPRGQPGYWGDHEFGFTLTSHSDDPALDGKKLDTFLHFIATRGRPGTPEQNADWLGFAGLQLQSDGSPPYTLRVYESFDGLNTGTADLYGVIHSLELTDLANPQGGAFLYPGADPIPDLAPIPEPGTLLLLATSLTGLSVAGWRRRVKQQ